MNSPAPEPAAVSTSAPPGPGSIVVKESGGGPHNGNSPGARPRGKSKKVVVAVVLTLVIAGLGAGAYYRQHREVVLSVQTETVQRRTLTETVEATGKIQPVVQVVINPEVSGEIIELPVKEGQLVAKGDLLLKIKPDNYISSVNSAKASFQSSKAGQNLAQANLTKAEIEFKRTDELFRSHLVTDTQFVEAKTSLAVAKANFENSTHQAEMAQASLAKAQEDLTKTTIVSPMKGTVTKLKSQRGERVVGTAMMAGTEIMTVADLEDMEARVDIGEMDIVLIGLGQTARLEVDAFKERKFTGTVYELANAAKTSAANTQQEATKFEVKIRIKDKEQFRPGMSVTAQVETRTRTNVLAVPIQSVTSRLPKKEGDKSDGKPDDKKEQDKNDGPPLLAMKKDPTAKPVEVVFMVEGDKAKKRPVKRGISDDEFTEIIEGVKERQVVVSGGYKTIHRELEEGKTIKVENKPPASGPEKK